MPIESHDWIYTFSCLLLAVLLPARRHAGALLGPGSPPPLDARAPARECFAPQPVIHANMPEEASTQVTTRGGVVVGVWQGGDGRGERVRVKRERKVCLSAQILRSNLAEEHHI